METDKKKTLTLKNLGIDTYKESVIYMRQDCDVCASEGFRAPARVQIDRDGRSIIATLNTVVSDILEPGEAGLSQHAWKLLQANDGDEVSVSHARHVRSLSYVRGKIYGNRLTQEQITEIITDITAGRYSDIHLSSFLTACAGGTMDNDELMYLTKAMVDAGETLSWDVDMVVDKHSVGGLPGNRTTPIVVSIVTAFGLTMPKTSSRAITSPAGTADTMEVLTTIDHTTTQMKEIVKKERGCIIWGGAVNLSPADDLMIGVERTLNFDSETQLVASVLSKKIAAGSTHIVIDVPVGPTAKIRSLEAAEEIKSYFETIGQKLGVTVKVVLGDGTQPIGRGIGPALEARDVLWVLQNNPDAPQDLRKRSLALAAAVLEFSPKVKEGEGLAQATEVLESGKAWEKFQAICNAQGGLKEIPKAPYSYTYLAKRNGVVTEIDNRRIALIAKLAGAPHDKAAGVDLLVSLGNTVKHNDELFTIHAESPGELAYALDYLETRADVITLEE